MSEDKKEFEFEGTEYAVIKPTLAMLNEASKVYNRTFSSAINSGAIIRERLDDVLREQGLWSDEKDRKYQTLRREILDAELKIKKGGIRLLEGKQLALDIKAKRSEMVDMLMSRNNLDSNTAEGQADNMRFNYLVSACLVYKKTNKPYFKNLEDYLNKAVEPLSVEAARQLYNLLYRTSDNMENDLTENRFLKRFNFVDDKLRLINEDGRLVDENGRLIDENGRFIDEDGDFVDVDGNPVTEDGEYLVDEMPFLDEDGEPIVDIQSEEETEEEDSIKTEKTTS
jgi:hypothetical protein